MLECQSIYYLIVSLMIEDFTALAKLKRVDLKQGGEIVKYLVTQGTEDIPPKAKMWIHYKKYNFEGEFISEQKSLIYKQSENSRHKNPQSLGFCLSTMKKGFSGKQYEGRENARPSEGVYYCISIQKYKVLSLASDKIEERKQIFRENKKVAQQYFNKGNYKSALEYYKECKNSYISMPGKRNISAEIKDELGKEIEICLRNMCLCVIKGKMEDQYDSHKQILEGLVKRRPENAKNLYILGKLQLVMKYPFLAKQSFVKSYKLDPNESTLKAIRDLEKKEKNQQFVFKKVVDNMDEFNQKEEDEMLRKQRQEKLKEINEQPIEIQPIQGEQDQESSQWLGSEGDMLDDFEDIEEQVRETKQ